MSDQRENAALLDLFAVAMTGGSGAILSRESEDLDVNLVRFSDGAGVAPHLNREVDVLVVGIAGSGTVRVENEKLALSPGKAILILKGTERAFQSLAGDEFVYLTVHRRRRGLMPTRRQTSEG